MSSFRCTDAFSGVVVLRPRSREQQELAPQLTTHAQNEKSGEPPTGKDEDGLEIGSLSAVVVMRVENITEALFQTIPLGICYSSL